jgi:hypothetical protein
MQEIWERVSSTFHGDAIGMVDVKGKGMVSVFGLRAREA